MALTPAELNAAQAQINAARDQAHTNIGLAEGWAQIAQDAANASGAASAQVATAEANRAGQQKALAETARTGAETARTGAETARTGAETAQGLAETAQGLAEDARDRAEAVPGTSDTLMASILGDPDSETRAVGDATYGTKAEVANMVPRNLVAAKRSGISQIAVPVDELNRKGPLAKLNLLKLAPGVEVRTVGVDGRAYGVYNTYTVWRTVDGFATWEVGPSLYPWMLAPKGTGGTWTVTVDGQTTAAIAHDATASQVKTALASLSNVGFSNVNVYDKDGGTTGQGPFTVRLYNAARNLPVSASSELTGAGAKVVCLAHGILWVTRTSAGYLIFTRAQNADADALAVWHTTWWNTASNPSIVHASRSTSTTGFARQRDIAGQTWLMYGEYVTTDAPKGASVPLRRFLSTDGGLTWKSVHSTSVVNANVNSHHHTGLIQASGRIWSSEGDGPNAWFGYSDDKGESWVDVRTPAWSEVSDSGSVFMQPTTMIDFAGDDRIAVAPDRGPFPPGIWDIDASTNLASRNYDLPGLYELTPGNGNDAAAQYGHPVYAQAGRIAYVMWPDTGSGVRKSYIGATGDWGRTWWLVAEIPWGETGAMSTGVVGVDAAGFVYVKGTNVETYGSSTVRALGLRWEWQMLPTS